jgi:hypothetical protein
MHPGADSNRKTTGKVRVARYSEGMRALGMRRLRPYVLPPVYRQ